MAIVRFNKGGSQPVTVSATTGTNLTITVNGRAYTTAGQGTATATAAFFVSEHGASLASEFGIFVSSATTTLTLNGIGDTLILVSSGGSLGSADLTTERGVEFNFMLQYVVASATSITVNLNTSSFDSSADVLTMTFLSSKDRSAFIPALQKVLSAQETGKAIIDCPIVCSVAWG